MPLTCLPLRYTDQPGAGMLNSLPSSCRGLAADHNTSSLRNVTARSAVYRTAPLVTSRLSLSRSEAGRATTTWSAPAFQSAAEWEGQGSSGASQPTWARSPSRPISTR